VISVVNVSAQAALAVDVGAVLATYSGGRT